MALLLRRGHRQLPNHIAREFSGSGVTRVYKGMSEDAGVKIALFRGSLGNPQSLSRQMAGPGGSV